MEKRSPDNRPTWDGKDRATLLVVSSFQEDLVQLRRMLDRSVWNLRSAGTFQEALALLRENSVAVVICERDLPDGSWRDVMSMLTPVEHAPRLIVISRLADERLWAEVMNLGGFDVLSKPFYEKEVAWVTESVWRQQQKRNPRARCAEA